MFFIKCPWCGEATPPYGRSFFTCESCEEVILQSMEFEEYEEEEDGQDD